MELVYRDPFDKCEPRKSLYDPDIMEYYVVVKETVKKTGMVEDRTETTEEGTEDTTMESGILSHVGDVMVTPEATPVDDVNNNKEKLQDH